MDIPYDIRARIEKLINIVYAGTSNALSVADQLTFFWSMLLLADDSPKKLKYPFKSRLSYTWAELRYAGSNSLDIIQGKVLPQMKGGRSYLPKRMAKGGEKLTITPAQCHEIVESLSTIYDLLDHTTIIEQNQSMERSLYDYMLNILFQESIEGAEGWMSEGLVSFLTTFVSFQSSNLEEQISIYDVNCRSGQVLTTAYDGKSSISRLYGQSQSPIMTRIATFRLLLSGAKSFSILHKNAINVKNNSFFSKARSGRDEKFDIVYVYPPRGKQKADSWWKDSNNTIETDFHYLLYGINICRAGGWIFAILPKVLLESDDVTLWDQITERTQIKSIIELPRESKLKGIEDEIVLVVILNDTPTTQQSIRDIRRVQLPGYEEYRISQFLEDFNSGSSRSASSDLFATMQVNSPYKLYEPLLQSIINLEGSLMDSKDTRSQVEKLNEWRSGVNRLGTSREIALTLQRLIRDNRVEATISDEGEVLLCIVRINSRSSEYGFEQIRGTLSPDQRQLYQVFCDSNIPLAIHKARQALTNEAQRRFTIQHAVDTVHMLGRMGLLERIDESIDGDLSGNAYTIDLWMKVPKGGRPWRFTTLR